MSNMKKAFIFIIFTLIFIFVYIQKYDKQQKSLHKKINLSESEPDLDRKALNNAYNLILTSNLKDCKKSNLKISENQITEEISEQPLNFGYKSRKITILNDQIVDRTYNFSKLVKADGMPLILEDIEKKADREIKENLKENQKTKPASKKENKDSVKSENNNAHLLDTRFTEKEEGKLEEEEERPDQLEDEHITIDHIVEENPEIEEPVFQNEEIPEIEEPVFQDE